MPSPTGCDVQAHDSRIEIWSAAASGDQPGELERRCESWLTAEERQRAMRFRKPTTRNQHVVGRGMARKLLAMPPNLPAAAPPVDPAAIQLGFTTHGKPYVIAPQTVARPFNVAHTEGMVLFASFQRGGATGGQHAASDQPRLHDTVAVIGVDVEPLERRTDVALAERYFAASEVEYVFDHRSAEERLAAFLRVWTLKEALIKAIGTGLTLPLGDFAFEQIDDRRPRVRMLKPELGSGDRWRFLRFSPADGFIGALAWSDDAADHNSAHRDDDDRGDSDGNDGAADYQLRRFESLLADH